MKTEERFATRELVEDVSDRDELRKRVTNLLLPKMKDKHQVYGLPFLRNRTDPKTIREDVRGFVNWILDWQLVYIWWDLGFTAPSKQEAFDKLFEVIGQWYSVRYGMRKTKNGKTIDFFDFDTQFFTLARDFELRNVYPDSIGRGKQTRMLRLQMESVFDYIQAEGISSADYVDAVSGIKGLGVAKTLLNLTSPYVLSTVCRKYSRPDGIMDDLIAPKG